MILEPTTVFRRSCVQFRHYMFMCERQIGWAAMRFPKAEVHVLLSVGSALRLAEGCLPFLSVSRCPWEAAPPPRCSPTGVPLVAVEQISKLPLAAWPPSGWWPWAAGVCCASYHRKPFLNPDNTGSSQERWQAQGLFLRHLFKKQEEGCRGLCQGWLGVLAWTQVPRVERNYTLKQQAALLIVPPTGLVSELLARKP